jgi:molybdopterin converting factor small subunit
MEVKVYAPGFLNRNQTLNKGIIVIAENSTLDDLFVSLRLPDSFRLSLLHTVNNTKADWDHELHEGDQVVFMFPFAGG